MDLIAWFFLFLAVDENDLFGRLRFAGNVAEIFGIVVFYGCVDYEENRVVYTFIACEGDFANFFNGGFFECDDNLFWGFGIVLFLLGIRHSEISFSVFMLILSHFEGQNRLISLLFHFYFPFVSLSVHLRCGNIYTERYEKTYFSDLGESKLTFERFKLPLILITAVSPFRRFCCQ